MINIQAYNPYPSFQPWFVAALRKPSEMSLEAWSK